MAIEVKIRSWTPAVETRRDPALENPSAPDASDSALFDIYQQMIESRFGAQDAHIFQKIREWRFSDFSLQPYEFAGVTKSVFDDWQSRHRINLSTGHVLPDSRELQRNYA